MGRFFYKDVKMKSLSRVELVNSLRSSLNITAKVADRCVDTILDEIVNALSNEEDVHLQGFGTFSVIQQKARVGRNMDTMEEVTIPATKIVSFKCSHGLKMYLNGDKL